MAFRPMVPMVGGGLAPVVNQTQQPATFVQQQAQRAQQAQQPRQQQDQSRQQPPGGTFGNPLFSSLRGIGQKVAGQYARMQTGLGQGGQGYSSFLENVGISQLGGTTPASAAHTAGYLAGTSGTGLTTTGAGSQASMLAGQTAGFGESGAALTAEALGAEGVAGGAGAGSTTATLASTAGTALMGAAVMMWANAFIQDQFGKSEARFNFVTSKEDGKGLKDNVGVKSPFGFIGYGQESRKMEADKDDNKKVLEVMAKIDEGIARGMSSQQIQNVSQTLDSYGDQTGRHEISEDVEPDKMYGDLVRRRYRDIFQAAGNTQMVEELDKLGDYLTLESQRARPTPWDMKHDYYSMLQDEEFLERVKSMRAEPVLDGTIIDMMPERAQTETQANPEYLQMVDKYNWGSGAPTIEKVINTVTMAARSGIDARPESRTPIQTPTQQPIPSAPPPGMSAMTAMRPMSPVGLPQGRSGFLPMNNR